MLRRDFLKGIAVMPFGNAVGQGFVNPLVSTFSAGGTVITKLGIFIYNGVPGVGNPPIFWISDGVTEDPYGNTLNAAPGAVAIGQAAAYGVGYTGEFALGGMSGQEGIPAVQIASGASTDSDSEAGISLLSASANALATGVAEPSVTVDGYFQLQPAEGMIFLMPSGDSSGATDVAAINGALADNLETVWLLPGNYYINAPIVIPGSQTRLTGDFWWSAVDSDNYSAGAGNTGGALITMVPAFAGSAAIEMVNTTNNQYYGVDISGITIEGNEVPSGTIYGILVDGAWGACFLRGVCIHRPPADCIRFITDPTSGKIPDDWIIQDCKFSASRNGYGFYASELADSTISNCESSENDLDGWYINYGVQSRWEGCKGENNGRNGFHCTGLGADQVQRFIGCSTHINNLDGFLFDNAGPSGGGQATYMLSACVAQEDGTGGAAISAGFKALGCNSRVMGIGCVTAFSGTTPHYGAYEGTASFGMCHTGSSLFGATAATFDDGSNTHALVNQSPVPF